MKKAWGRNDCFKIAEQSSNATGSDDGTTNKIYDNMFQESQYIFLSASDAQKYNILLLNHKRAERAHPVVLKHPSECSCRERITYNNTLDFRNGIGRFHVHLELFSFQGLYC